MVRESIKTMCCVKLPSHGRSEVHTQYQTKDKRIWVTSDKIKQENNNGRNENHKISTKQDEPRERSATRHSIRRRQLIDERRLYIVTMHPRIYYNNA